MVTAQRAVRVPLQLHFTEGHTEGVDEEQPGTERFAYAQEVLQRFSGLDAADQTGEGTQYARLSAVGNHARRRGRWEQAAVAALPR